MASIGHELQHAVEALSEAGVRTNALIYAFFERLSGSPSARGQLEFETDAEAIISVETPKGSGGKTARNAAVRHEPHSCPRTRG